MEENAAFAHRDCTPGGRHWGFAGQRYTLLTIPGCCSGCLLCALFTRDLGLDLTSILT